MKKTTQLVLMTAFLAFSGIKLRAQNTVSAQLNEVITAAENMKTTANQAKTTLKTLVVDYFVNNNPTPNTTAFLSKLNQELTAIETEITNAYTQVYEAESLSPNIDVSTVEDLGQDVQTEVYQLKATDAPSLVTAIENDVVNDAYLLNTKIRTRLDAIISISESVIAEAINLQSTPYIFKVRITLVDERTGASVPVNTIQGYSATNTQTNQHYYTQEYQGDPVDIFPALPEGTYTFDGRDGYFDGTGSKTVTLSNALVGSDGYIVVTLKYWSE